MRDIECFSLVFITTEEVDFHYTNESKVYIGTHHARVSLYSLLPVGHNISAGFLAQICCKIAIYLL